MACDKCASADGKSIYPMYGVAPHTCYHKIPGASMGQSQLLPKEQWPDNFMEDPDCAGQGTYWCEGCGAGRPSDLGAAKATATIDRPGELPVETVVMQEFLNWNRSQPKPIVPIGREYAVARKLLTLRAERIAPSATSSGAASPPDGVSDPFAHTEDGARKRQRLGTQGMADCMDMVRQELIAAGVIDPTIPPMMVANAVLTHISRLTAAFANAANAQALHSDDVAVNRFADTMREKMAVSRAKGRNGWDDPDLCPTGRLQTMLLEHIPKGDPVDVALFCMMLHARGAQVVATPPAKSSPIYYMRDNHAQRVLPEDLDGALAAIGKELDDGYTSGSLFTRRPGSAEGLQFSYLKTNLEQLAAARAWLTAELAARDRSDCID